MPDDDNQSDNLPSPIRTEGGTPVRRAEPVDQNRDVRRATPVDGGQGQRPDPVPYPSPDIPEGASQQYRDALQQEFAMRKQWQQDESMLQKDQAWARQKTQELLSQPLPRMPSFDQAYPQPLPPWQLSPQYKDLKHKYATALMAYSAIMVPLAAFAGVKGGGGGNAFAEGLNAMNQGFNRRAQQAGALWKAQSDALVKHGENLMQYYRDIIENRKTTVTEKKELINLAATFWSDKATQDKAMLDDWHQVVEHLGKMDDVVKNAKQVRQTHEAEILHGFGLDAMHADYVQRLVDKDPALRLDVKKHGGDYSTIQDSPEYNKAVNRYTWTQFLKDRDREISDEAKARAEGKGLGLPDEENPEDTGQQAQEMTPEHKSQLDDFARKLRGGQ